MENRIGKIITLDDQNQYIVLDQGMYRGKNYYLCNQLDKKKELLPITTILEEEDDFCKSVEEVELLKKLLDYFQSRIEEE